MALRRDWYHADPQAVDRQSDLQAADSTADTEFMSSGGLKTCPECAEEVRAAARVCRFCGHRFDSTREPLIQPSPTTSAASLPPPSTTRPEPEESLSDPCGEPPFWAVVARAVWGRGRQMSPLRKRFNVVVLVLFIGIGAVAYVQHRAHKADEPCIILAAGGNKLCGSDAAAWCRSTDSIRQSASNLSSDPTTSSSLSQSESDCSSIEAQYP